MVCIEEPRVFHSPGGHAVALAGALEKLFFTVAYISCSLRIVYGCDVLYIPVSNWKGQLPKQLTTMRVNRKYNLSLNWRTKEHNAADAIAMGDWWITKNLPRKGLKLPGEE